MTMQRGKMLSSVARQLRAWANRLIGAWLHQIRISLSITPGQCGTRLPARCVGALLRRRSCVGLGAARWPAVYTSPRRVPPGLELATVRLTAAQALACSSAPVHCEVLTWSLLLADATSTSGHSFGPGTIGAVHVCSFRTTLRWSGYSARSSQI